MIVLFEMFGPVLIVIVAVVVVIALILSIWKRVPVDKAMVVTGLKKRVLSGKGGIVIPIIETTCQISLEDIIMTTDVADAPSVQGIFVDVVGTAAIKVDNTDAAILKATEQFCANNPNETIMRMKTMVEQILEGKLRGVVSSMTVEEINGNRAVFEQKIEADITKELTEMGLKLLSYSILKIATKSGYLENKSRPEVAKSVSDAKIAEAERVRDIAMRTAEATRDGQKVALAADTEIARAERDKQVTMEAYRAEQNTSKVLADNAAAFQDIANKSLLADEDIKLAEKEANVAEKKLLSTVKMPAEAAKYKTEIDAAAEKNKSIANAQAAAEQKKLSADSEAYGATAQARADAEVTKLTAEAQATATKMTAAANAEAIEKVGTAEADVIVAKGRAEAEAMAKKADAFKQYNDAAKTSMLIEVLPALAASIASPLASIDKVIVMNNGDGSNGGGVGSIAGNVTKVMANIIEAVNNVTGIDLTEVARGMTYDAKVTKNINLTGMPNSEKSADATTADAMADVAAPVKFMMS